MNVDSINSQLYAEINYNAISTNHIDRWHCTIKSLNVCNFAFSFQTRFESIDLSTSAGKPDNKNTFMLRFNATKHFLIYILSL